MKPLRTAVALALAAGLTACSGAPSLGVLPPAPPAFKSRVVHRGNEKLVLRVRVPKKRRQRPDYISPATASIAVTIAGPSDASVKSPLAPGVDTLTIGGLAPCPSAGNCYTASVTTYDAGGHPLSADQDVAFSIVGGRANSLAMTLGGIPATVVVLPDASSAITGNANSGFGISKCTGPQNVSVLGVDADGNYVLGAGAPAPSLISDDPAHLAVATPAPSAPNRFTITRPAIPSAHAVVHLTASVTPSAGSGGSAVQSPPIPVQFNGDVCGIMSEFTVPTAAAVPFGITTGPDGALWFTEKSANKIGRITTDGAVAEPRVLANGAEPYDIVTGPDDKLWFTEESGNAIGNLTTAGTLNETTVPTANAYPRGIAAGSDGALWFTEFGTNKIGRILTGGLITGEFTTTDVDSEITLGNDGALWFPQTFAKGIGRITTTASITTATPTSYAPFTIANGPDGNLWFAEGSTIGRVTLGGKLAEFPVSDNAFGITAGPDNAIWFTEDAAGKIGRIATDGTIVTYYALGKPATLEHITTGPDGALWFTDTQNNAIGRLQ
jgi:virginiamycin B lyase